MDTESRYLRDIRDAIKGIAKRSGMDVSGNAKSKYLKEIADAIRENGGGGKDGNDKVKQTPVVTTEQSFDSYNVLLSGSNINFSSSEITEGARKSPGFEYHADKTQLLVRNKECNTYGYTNNPNIGIFYGKEVDHVYNYKGAMLLTDDVSLTGNDNTWDGINTSLKAALANAKSNDIFVANFSLVSTGDYLYPMFLQETGYTISSTGPSVNYGTQNEFYLDKSYEEILAAIQAGKIPLILSPAKQIWVLYSTPSQSEDAMVFEDIKNHAFYFDDNNNELSITTSKITIMPSPSPTNG